MSSHWQCILLVILMPPGDPCLLVLPAAVRPCPPVCWRAACSSALSSRTLFWHCSPWVRARSPPASLCLCCIITCNKLSVADPSMHDLPKPSEIPTNVCMHAGCTELLAASLQALLSHLWDGKNIAVPWELTDPKPRKH